MIIKLNDKVRSLGGVEGQIVSLDRRTRSGMVQVPGVWRGTGLVSIPLNRLTQIEAYSASEAYFPCTDEVSIASAAPYNRTGKSLSQLSF